MYVLLSSRYLNLPINGAQTAQSTYAIHMMINRGDGIFMEDSVEETNAVKCCCGETRFLGCDNFTPCLIAYLNTSMRCAGKRHLLNMVPSYPHFSILMGVLHT
jgi:hypothetical protein